MQGLRGVSRAVLAHDNLRTGTGWQQSKQKWVPRAVQRQPLRTGCNDLCVVSTYHLPTFCAFTPLRVCIVCSGVRAWLKGTRTPGQTAGRAKFHIRFADGHTASNAPDLFRPPKLSGAGPGQYWGGGPPGKTLGCCQLLMARARPVHQRSNGNSTNLLKEDCEVGKAMHGLKEQHWA